MSLPHVPNKIGAMLRAHQATLGLSDPQMVALVADATRTPEVVVEGWLVADTAVRGTDVIRKVLTKVGIDRAVATATLEHHILASALWSPAAGAALRTARLTAGLSEAQIAERAGVSALTITRWETANTAPLPAKLAGVLDALALDVTSLLEVAKWPPTEVPVGNRPAFALWLSRERDAAGLGQSALARSLGLAQPTYNAWEMGRKFPEAKSWERLAAQLTRVLSPISAEQMLMLSFPQPADAADAPNPVAAALITARLDRVLSYGALAHLTGLTVAAVRNFERGVKLPTITQARTLATALWLSPNALVDLTQDTIDQQVEDRTTVFLRTRFAGRADRGAYVAARIDALGLRDRDVAEAIGVHRNELSFWSTGKVAMPEHVTGPLADILGVHPGVLEARPAKPDTAQARLGRSLLSARVGKGMTQRQLAGIVGLTQTRISAFEAAKDAPRGRVAALLAEVLDMPIAA